MSSLSDSERASFAALEAQLRETDPEFARKLNSASNRTGKTSTRNVVLGTIGFLVGLVVLFLGISTQLAFVGILGFILMGAGTYFGTLKTVETTGASNASSGTARGPKQSGTFMKRLEDSWEERRRAEGR